MNHKTQYEKIVAYLRKHREATMRQLMLVSGSSYPWKRMAESGYTFDSRWKTTGRGRYKVYWLRTKVA